MLQFNELRITPDNKCLIIDVQVEDLAYFKNVKIDSILIDTQDTWVYSGPSDKAVLLYSQDSPALSVVDNEGKHVRIEAEQPLIVPAENNMYFVYVVADISNAPESMQAPCDCNKDTIIGTAVNVHSFRSLFMKGIKEIENSCEMPVTLVNAYLRQQAVEACLKTGNYPLAIKYWKMFFQNINQTVMTKTCNCNGGV